MARKLGKGLDALLHAHRPVRAADAAADADAAASTSDAASGELRRVPIEEIAPGEHQPRRTISEASIEELAQSITAQGIIEPIVLRPRTVGTARGDARNDARFELIAGERRWRAAMRAGLKTVPAVVREVDDREALAMALIENIQRENLNPIDEALGLQRLSKTFALTQKELGEAVGKSRAAIANALRLLKLDAEVQDLLETGELDVGHARALLSLDAAEQVKLARRIVAGQLSVRQVEALVAQRRGKSPGKPTRKTKKGGANTDTQRLAREMGEKIGARVSIEHQKSGAGRIVIRYTNLDELDHLLKRF